MEVYLENGGKRTLIGRAEVPEDCGASYVARAFGAGFSRAARFRVDTVAGGLALQGDETPRRAVVAAPGQPVELLPGWVPVAA